MTRIGLLSDTHGFIHPGIYDFFKDAQEIWHAGDIGNLKTLEELNTFKPVRAVYGNIDGTDIRSRCPETEIFHCEGLKVLMIHIGGYPGKYEKKARDLIRLHNPQIFISGHSHILKVLRDENNDLLHVNPGAAGNFGSHRVVTMVRFKVNGEDISDFEIFEGRRNRNGY
jgi:putative phosphoesterase